MKRGLIVVALVVLFVSSPRGQQTDGGKVLELFLARKQDPVTQCVTIRHLYAEAPGKSASMDVEAEQKGKTLTLRVIHEEGSARIRNEVMWGVLNGEKALVEEGALGFSRIDYRFGPVKKTQEGLWKTTAYPLRKGGLLSESTLFLDSTGNLIRLEGKLAKKPHPLVFGARVEISYREILGIRMPVRWKSTSKVFIVVAFVSATLEMNYVYRSINGAEVEVIK